jgi:ABC-type transporter Mla subunit MlaD
MATRANYVKIGLFVIFGLFTALALAVGLGAAAAHHETVAMVTYFNESVQGLGVGAPVSFRGVKLGEVSKIGIALERLGLVPRGTFKMFRELPPPPPDLRTQLGSQGLSGAKYVATDYFDPKTNPPPTLSFPPASGYVPAAKSSSKGLEESVAQAMDSLIHLSETSLVVVQRVDGIVAALERGHVGEETTESLGLARSVLEDVDRMVRAMDRSRLGPRASATVDVLHSDLEQLGRVMGHLEGDDGLLASATRSVAALGELGRNVTGSTRALEGTLAEIREAATAIRLLADELDRQPDALVKGRGGGQTQ